MDDRNNRERIFKDLVGVSSRYEKNPTTDKGHNLLVGVAFNEAVFGRDPDDEVSFKLKVRAAKLMVMVKDPRLQTDLNSILNTNPSHNWEIEETSGQSNETSFGAEVKLKINPELNVNAGNKENLEIGQIKRYEAGPIDYFYYPDANKNYHTWILNPYLNKEHLQGNVWNGDKKLLTVIDSSNDPDSVLSPIKIIIRCNREDLDIINSEKSGLFTKKPRVFTKKQNNIAMEMIKDALIECKLAESDLSVKKISHNHASIPLADILVEIK